MSACRCSLSHRQHRLLHALSYNCYSQQNNPPYYYLLALSVQQSCWKDNATDNGIAVEILQSKPLYFSILAVLQAKVQVVGGQVHLNLFAIIRTHDPYPVRSIDMWHPSCAAISNLGAPRCWVVHVLGAICWRGTFDKVEAWPRAFLSCASAATTWRFRLFELSKPSSFTHSEPSSYCIVRLLEI
ncbi:hypothetical protein GOP47_0004830 [Adiantum capillus-veneris]|uniref:Uncharacterized protein n=1 Tax=Adiantum capillus-veneris TaxID=13818 RepID=A0A9D4V406_ADICA|nr:hypothetical protein GOP47_0004830 [Adiantum capillus-veneris]